MGEDKESTTEGVEESSSEGLIKERRTLRLQSHLLRTLTVTCLNLIAFTNLVNLDFAFFAFIFVL
jgi:hypothetical protein